MGFRITPKDMSAPETRAVISGFSVKHRFVSPDADVESAELVRPSNWNDDHDITGGVRGDILYRGAAGWATLSAGSAGYVLQTNGPSADPGWVAPPAGGGGTPADDSVTYAKMQNVSATARVLGRKTAAAGDPEECTLSEVLDFIGSAARGDILYRGAAGWAKLAAGTSGYFLKTNGAAADPAWAAAAGASSGPWVYLTDFGVVADGSTDDTAAINACFASIKGQTATVIWPRGFCKTTDSIIIGDLSPGTSQSHISIIGSGSCATGGVNYTGPTDRPAVIICKNTNFRIQDIAVRNTGAKGTTKGILIGGPGFGNQSANYIISGVLVYGFSLGIAPDGNGGCSSEGTYENVSLAGCDTGWRADDFNTLDFNFLNCSFGSNTVCAIDAGVAGGFNVLGGSASFNAADFIVRQNAVVNITGFRTEGSGMMVQGVSARKANILGCTSAEITPIFVSIGGTFSSLRVEDCYLQGSITLTGFPETVEINGNTLDIWDTTRQIPIFLPTTDAAVAKTRASFRGNLDSGVFPPRAIADSNGILGSRDNGTSVVPFFDGQITIISQDRTGSPTSGLGYVALSHVRQLSETIMAGITSGTGAPTPGKNLRVSGTFVSSNTLAFTFIRTGLTVNAGGPTVTATTGTFRPTDAGKPLKITAGADTGADWYGYITDYVSATVVRPMPANDATPGGRYPSCTGKAAQVGENEPDANYIVAGLVGNVGETFWVDNLTATGFTLHSSNATSTATVTALIVR